MPRAMTKHNSRIALRIRPDDKAILMRAVALEETDMTSFVVKNVMQAAKAVIDRSESVKLSKRDSLRVLELLENPPTPNAKLLAAAHALPTDP